jgi:hypothetical protein
MHYTKYADEAEARKSAGGHVLENLSGAPSGIRKCKNCKHIIEVSTSNNG